MHMFMSHHQNGGQNPTTNTVNESFGNVATFEHQGTKNKTKLHS